MTHDGVLFRLTLNTEHRYAQRDIVLSVAKRIDMNDVRFWPRNMALALSAASTTRQVRRPA